PRPGRLPQVRHRGRRVPDLRLRPVQGPAARDRVPHLGHPRRAGRGADVAGRADAPRGVRHARPPAAAHPRHRDRGRPGSRRLHPRGTAMTIPVVWWTSHITCWDQAMVDAALTGRSWPTGYQFEHHVHTDTAPWEPPAGTTGAVLVIPASRHAGDVDAINAQLAALDWALVILTSDEERQFPLDALQHPNLAVWLQYPHAKDRADWVIPVGPTPHLRGLLDDLDYQAKEGWFFAGQVTNTRREQCARALRALAGGRLVETAGFT